MLTSALVVDDAELPMNPGLANPKSKATNSPGANVTNVGTILSSKGSSMSRPRNSLPKLAEASFFSLFSFLFLPFLPLNNECQPPKKLFILSTFAKIPFSLLSTTAEDDMVSPPFLG
jgi:hypothetical protein